MGWRHGGNEGMWVCVRGCVSVLCLRHRQSAVQLLACSLSLFLFLFNVFSPQRSNKPQDTTVLLVQRSRARRRRPDRGDGRSGSERRCQVTV